ncbi:hypothetical protein [uncultured Clostridium sp.]|uniref:hypothetical protein n=1 Tax=uncultured Clostridium sp. TaxID=59620 RepID=UPI002637C65D|nr:hypothetical protein [uncultured Clostridium sp.]
MKKLFEEYKNISLKILEELDIDEFLKLEEFLDEKDKIQKEIISLNLKQEEMKSNLEYFNIIETDKAIVEKIMKKKVETKGKLNDVKIRKNASTAYSNASGNMQILNGRF